MFQVHRSLSFDSLTQAYCLFYHFVKPEAFFFFFQRSKDDISEAKTQIAYCGKRVIKVAETWLGRGENKLAMLSRHSVPELFRLIFSCKGPLVEACIFELIKKFHLFSLEMGKNAWKKSTSTSSSVTRNGAKWVNLINSKKLRCTLANPSLSLIIFLREPIFQIKTF